MIDLGPDSRQTLLRPGDRVVITSPRAAAGCKGVVASACGTSVYVIIRVPDEHGVARSALLRCNTSDPGDWHAEPDPAAIVPRYLVLEHGHWRGDAPTLDEAYRMVRPKLRLESFRVIDRWDPDDLTSHGQ